MVSQVYRLLGDHRLEAEERLHQGVLDKIILSKTKPESERRHTHFDLFSDIQVGANLDYVAGNLAKTVSD